MNTQSRLVLKTITYAIFLFGLLASSLLPAQSIWYGREKKNSINIEINKPFIPPEPLGTEEVNLDAWSSSIFLSGKYSLKKNKNITFVADIPVAHGFINSDLVLNGSEWMFGNPYLGAEFDIPKSPVYFELGLRIPLASEEKGVAALAGITSDLNRGEAFASHVLPVYFAANYETVSDSKIFLRLRGGVNLRFRTDSLKFGGDPSVHIDYDAQTGYIDKNFNVIFSIIGREDLSSGVLRRKPHVLQYGLSVVVPYKKIRPGISFRVPGNNLSDLLINYVVGLNFGYVF